MDLLGASCASPRAQARGCLRHPQAILTPASNREGSHPPLIAAIQPHRRTSHLRTSNLAEREGLLGASCASPRAQARGCLRHPQAFLTPASNREGSHPPSGA